MFGGRRKADIDNILIVEDEALVAFDNEHVLTESGYHVVGTVDNAGAAMSILETRSVGLVLTDLSLRGDTGGLAVAAAAHARGVPVLLVSGSSIPEAPAGAVGLLGKPYGDKDLLSAIETVADVVSGRPPRKPSRKLTLYTAL